MTLDISVIIFVVLIVWLGMYTLKFGHHNNKLTKTPKKHLLSLKKEESLSGK